MNVTPHRYIVGLRTDGDGKERLHLICGDCTGPDDAYLSIYGDEYSCTTFDTLTKYATKHDEVAHS